MANPSMELGMQLHGVLTTNDVVSIEKIIITYLFPFGILRYPLSFAFQCWYFQENPRYYFLQTLFSPAFSRRFVIPTRMSVSIPAAFRPNIFAGPKALVRYRSIYPFPSPPPHLKKPSFCSPNIIQFSLYFPFLFSSFRYDISAHFPAT